MSTERESLEAQLERRVEDAGYELVELERAGNAARPILRLKIDRPDADPRVPGSGVNLDECAAVSRSLEPWLDELPDLSPRYVIEVSSPGIERPLRRLRDWRRFSGADVSVQGKGELAEGTSRMEGVLVGIAGDDEGDAVATVRTAAGDDISFPLRKVRRAHLRHEWK